MYNTINSHGQSFVKCIQYLFNLPGIFKIGTGSLVGRLVTVEGIGWVVVGDVEGVVWIVVGVANVVGIWGKRGIEIN